MTQYTRIGRQKKRGRHSRIMFPIIIIWNDTKDSVPRYPIRIHKSHRTGGELSHIVTGNQFDLPYELEKVHQEELWTSQCSLEKLKEHRQAEIKEVYDVRLSSGSTGYPQIFGVAYVNLIAGTALGRRTLLGTFRHIVSHTTTDNRIKG